NRQFGFGFEQSTNLGDAVRVRITAINLIWITRWERILISGCDDSSRGIVHARQLLEGNVSAPFKFAGRAIQRDIAVKVRSYRYSPACLVADISGLIGIHKILPGSPEQSQRGSKLLPVLSPIDIEEGESEAIRGAPAHAVCFSILM